MNEENAAIEKDRQLLISARQKGTLSTLGAFFKLSGPGWLQSAITLGGGSLAGSLYLGVLGGAALLWLQPLAMILGVIMLSAISYVTLSTGERPFRAINKHINPVLGWGWIIATLMANLVWSLPQFSLGTAAVRQNLFPGILGPDAMENANLAKGIVCFGIMAICVSVVWFYDSGSKGIKFFEILLKVMVGLIVLCFFGVVVKMSASGVLDWGKIIGGFVPNINLLWAPAETYNLVIAEVDAAFQGYWKKVILDEQRQVMITAAATAVGINMTFLLPYSMLRRGWNKDFRGLAIFDLSTGLFIPFIIATSCVVIASSAQFHTTPEKGFLGEKDETGALIQPAPKLAGQFRKLALARIVKEHGEDVFAEFVKDEPTDLEKEALKKKQDEMIQALPDGDKRMAAMLVRRDALNLAQSLSPLTGDLFAHYVFGFGVLAMAVSSIIILMLINGFVLCEMVGVKSGGWIHRLGCLMPCVGVFGPFIWGSAGATFWLAVPTSMFGMVLLPIAYCTFFFMMNQKSLLGENLPKGGRRVAWNVLMLVAVALATFGSVFSLWSKFQWWGVAVLVVFTLAVVVVHFVRRARQN